MYSNLGKFDHDLTWRPKPIDDGKCKGNHPLLWPNYSGKWNILIYPDRLVDDDDDDDDDDFVVIYRVEYYFNVVYYLISGIFHRCPKFPLVDE